MPRIEKISSTPVRDCKRKKAWVFPNEIARIGKTLDILNYKEVTRNIAPLTTKNPAAAIKGLTFFVFINLDYRKCTKKLQISQSIGPLKLGPSLSLPFQSDLNHFHFLGRRDLWKDLQQNLD